MSYYEVLLMSFPLFCMLEDSWRMDCRSQVSDGKKRCFDAISRRSEKYWKIIFSQKTEEARRGGIARPQGTHPLGAGPPCPAPRAGVAHLAGSRLCPLAYIFPTKP